MQMNIAIHSDSDKELNYVTLLTPYRLEANEQGTERGLAISSLLARPNKSSPRLGHVTAKSFSHC